MSNETKKTKTRRKLQKKRQAKEIKKISKPHDKLAKDLEDVERKYTKGLLKHRSGDNLSEKQKKALKYTKEVLESKTPKAFPIKPKPTTKRKIKTDLAKRNVGKAAKKVLKASANPYLLFLETALSPSPLNEGEEEAVRKMNEEYSRSTGILRNSGGTVKNYAKGVGVRKAKFMDN